MSPSTVAAAPGGALVAVPGVSVDGFRVPPFLLPIYQAAGMQYGVRWEILAAINEIETDYGHNLNVSTAGALGWMQFMPATWRSHGLDANRDGLLDPYNPIDAIFAAARYLRAAGAQRDLRRALFAYNHADWYVDAVLRRAQALAGLPQGLVGSLTWLAQGRFPVAAPARYGDVRSARADIRISSRPSAAAVAVNDLRIVAMGRSRRLGRFVRARDAQGNTYTYAGLGMLARYHPAPRPSTMSRSAARALRRAHLAAAPGATRLERSRAGAEDARRLGLDPRDTVPRRLRRGSRVPTGTVLGRLDRRVPAMRFQIRPAVKGALPVDPKPILDGWRLLDRSGPRSVAWRNSLVGPRARWRSIGQILLMRRDALARRVLRNRRVELYACGRRDVRTGLVDRRVLAALEYLAASGLKPTVTSLRCGHSRLTAGGRVSYHASGNAVDIAAINGIPIMGHQGPGSITDIAVRRLLTLQGDMRPDEIISLMAYTDAPNAYAMGDHADHIHLGFRPVRPTRADSLGPRRWVRLIARLDGIRNPTVRVSPSHAALSSSDTPRSASVPGG